jgi:hypothetical protein
MTNSANRNPRVGCDFGACALDVEPARNDADGAMGCCILHGQELLRSIGRGDNFLTRAPILPAWTIAAMQT